MKKKLQGVSQKITLCLLRPFKQGVIFVGHPVDLQLIGSSPTLALHKICDQIAKMTQH